MQMDENKKKNDHRQQMNQKFFLWEYPQKDSTEEYMKLCTTAFTRKDVWWQESRNSIKVQVSQNEIG